MSEPPSKTDFPFRSNKTEIHPEAFVAAGAQVHGDVHIGKDSGIWFNVVMRGDVNFIRIGERTNIQDLTMVHVTQDGLPTIIGNDVTIGHTAVLHACTVKDFALVGMGSVVLDGAVIGERAMVGAGSLVTQGTEIPPGVLALGSPAKVVRDLKKEELEYLVWSAEHYVRLSKTYLSP